LLQEPGTAGDALAAAKADEPLKPSVRAPLQNDPIARSILAGELPAAVPAPWHKKRGYWQCYLCGKYKPGQHVVEHLSHSHGVTAKYGPMKSHAVSPTGLFARQAG